MIHRAIEFLLMHPNIQPYVVEPCGVGPEWGTDKWWCDEVRDAYSPPERIPGGRGVLPPSRTCIRHAAYIGAAVAQAFLAPCFFGMLEEDASTSQEGVVQG